MLALASKVRYQIDPQNPYPNNFTGHIRALLADGSVVEERQPHLRGGAHERLSRAEIEEKFGLNAAHGGWHGDRGRHGNRGWRGDRGWRGGDRGYRGYGGGYRGDHGYRGGGYGYRGPRGYGRSRVVCRIERGYYGPVRRCFRR